MEYIFEVIDAEEYVWEVPSYIPDFEFDLLYTEIGAGGTVDIIDQNSNVIDTVNAGDTYQVEVLTEIVDDEDLNTATIIDPLQ